MHIKFTQIGLQAIVVTCLVSLFLYFICSQLTLYRFDDISTSNIDSHRIGINIFNNTVVTAEDRHEIETIIRQWQSIFLCTVGLNIDMNINQLSLDCDQLFANVSITDLLSRTFVNLNKNIFKYSYHHMISLRRQIMIFGALDSTVNANDINPLLLLFCKHYKFHQTLIDKHKYQWYHLHVSKSAGRAVKYTFGNLYGSVYSEQVCSDSRQFESPQCSVEYINKRKCRYIEHEVPAFSASDDDLYILNHDDTQYWKPSLCRGFVYLLPFRDPIERICSHAAHINQRPAFYATNNILRKKDSYIKIYKDQDNNEEQNDNILIDSIKNSCYNQDIIINGVKYRLLINGIDYRGFFKTMIESEINNTQYHKMSVQKPISSITSLEKRIRDTSTMSGYKLYQFDTPFCFQNRYRHNVELFPIEYVENLNESEFIYVVTRERKFHLQTATISKLRTQVFSNIFTSWLGYETLHYKKFSWLPSYVARSKITQQHFINAMTFMLQIDYVLPFSTWTKQNDNIDDKSIWNITLHKIYDNYLNVSNNYRFDQIWKIDNDFMYYYPDKQKIQNMKSTLQWTTAMHLKADPYTKVMPRDICDSILEDEKKLLLKWNKLDINLYKVAQMIENDDLDFYQRCLTVNNT